MIKCPRCKLSQEGTYRCQYCGYVLSKNKKNTKTIRDRLKDIIVAHRNTQVFATKKAKMTDHGGTRSGSDRRKYTYVHYFPEKRSGKDRRTMLDPRGQVARKRP